MASACACGRAPVVPSSPRVAARAATSSPSEPRRIRAVLLPRTHRLTSSSDFRRATRDGKRAGSRTLVAHLVVTDDPGPARIGFVVSKTVGNSVVRNRVQRRLRHLAREHLASLPGSAVLVIRALPASAEASYAELATDLSRCLGRVSA